MKETTPVLNVELNVTCPECEEYFDVLSRCGYLRDDLMQELCPSDECWSESHKTVDHEITCPTCGKEFRIVDVEW